jgi:hypothetical protein
MADAFDFNELEDGMRQLNEEELSAIVHPSGDWFLIMEMIELLMNQPCQRPSRINCIWASLWLL